MTRLILVPSAQTDWRVEGRLVGDTDLQINELGHRQAVADGEAIAAMMPSVVRYGPEQATTQTAQIIAHELGLKAKPLKGLREMDLGHWEGLTIDEFRDRFAKVYRQWRSDPTSVEAPEGESVVHAADRLGKVVQKLVRDHPGETIVLIVGHFAYAVLRCRLQDGDYRRFWDYVEGNEGWHEVVMDAPSQNQDKPAPPS